MCVIFSGTLETRSSYDTRFKLAATFSKKSAVGFLSDVVRFSVELFSGTIGTNPFMGNVSSILD